MVVRFISDKHSETGDEGVISMQNWLRARSAETDCADANSQSASAEISESREDRKLAPETQPAAKNVNRLSNRAKLKIIDESFLADLKAQKQAADVADKKLQEVIEFGVKKLRHKALTQKELTAILQKEFTAQEDITAAINYFIDSNYLDDYAVAQSIISKYSSHNGASRMQLQRKLMQRQVASDIIESVLAEIDEASESALLHDAAYARAAKLTGLEYTVAERRLRSYLARRGWQGYAAAQKAQEALAAAGIER